MKTKILIVYYNMHIGGSTSALVALLNEMDYSRYEVELLLLSREGEFLDCLPAQVTLLEIPTRTPVTTGLFSSIFRVYASLYTHIVSGNLLHRVAMEMLKWNGKNPVRLTQLMSLNAVRPMPAWPTEYDIAISTEFWPTYFTALKVRARRKIAWMHLNYIGAELDADFDRPFYAKFDTIVTVSERCLQSFQRCFPEYAGKATSLENIVPDTLIRKRAEEPAPEISADFPGITIVTVCRLFNRDKGIDRAVVACKRLLEQGIAVRWYVIGDGADRNILKKQIIACGVQNHFFLLGARSNPYPYIKHADLFALPSRNEGKPIAVTEALILGRPVLVTAYPSAVEQITPGVSGIIVENSDEAFCEGMVNLCRDRGLLQRLAAHNATFTLDNSAAMQAFYALLHADACTATASGD